MQRITISLPVEEWRELINFAEKENRPTRYQAELIFRDALIERGIIKTSEKQLPKRTAKKSKRRDLSPALQAN